MVYQGSVSAEGAAVYGGQLHCLGKRGDGLYRCVLDPETGQCSLETLKGLEGNRDSLSHTLLCVDASGTMLILEE